MKIGLLTFHDTNNYGAMLQAYALQSMINQLGGVCEIIDYKCENILKREMPPKILDEGFLRAPIVYLFSKMKAKKYRLIKEFSQKQCVISNAVYTKDTIVNCNKEYDIFLSGSDMIWELNVTGGDTTYLLDFVVDNRKKYAFSSSFGYSKVPSHFENITQNLLRQYQGISVRENGGKAIVASLANRDVSVTLDPTLLHTGQFWSNLEEVINIKDKYVFVYFDDPSNTVLNSAISYANKNGFTVVFLSDSLRNTKGIKTLRVVSVGQFLWLISHAECVFTASYHGVAFSINYNIPFYYYNRAHSDRIITLLHNLGLKNREIGNEDSNCKINWGEVNRRLNEERDSSIQYLISIIGMEG